MLSFLFYIYIGSWIVLILVFLFALFALQVLFKNLGVDLKDVAPTSLLKDRVREVEGNPDFSNKDAGSSQPQIVTDVKSGIVSSLNQVELPLEAATSSHPGGHSRILSQVYAFFIPFFRFSYYHYQ